MHPGSNTNSTFQPDEENAIAILFSITPKNVDGQNYVSVS